MNTQGFLVATMLGLVVAVPAMAMDHQPGKADPPAVSGQSAQLANPEMTNMQAASPQQDAAPATVTSSSTDNSSWKPLGYVMRGDKAYKRNYGN
jgi:hypothetical protein